MENKNLRCIIRFTKDFITLFGRQNDHQRHVLTTLNVDKPSRCL